MTSDNEADGESPREIDDVLAGTPAPQSEEVADEEPDSAAVASTRSSPAKGSVRKWLSAHWGPYRRWSWFLSIRKARKASLQFWHDRDPEQNASSKLPEGENVDLAAIWVGELYTPSTVEGLLGGIRELGWDKSRMHGDDLLKWMSEVRLGKQAGWRSLGHVTSDTNQHAMADHSVRLPNGVRSAMPMVISVTSSVTALVIGFIVAEEKSTELNDTLHAEYSSYFKNDSSSRWWHIVPHVLWGRDRNTSYQILRPDDCRSFEAGRRVDDIEKACVDWVSQNLPGLFASVLKDEGTPAAMLYITDVSQPLTEEARGVRAFDAVGLSRSWDSWQSDSGQ